MISFDKCHFSNSINEYYKNSNNQTTPSEVKYNLPKGLTGMFIISSAENNGISYIDLLSQAQNDLKCKNSSSSEKQMAKDHIIARIMNIIDVQQPLDNAKRYQRYFNYSRKIKIKDKDSDIIKSLDHHYQKDACYIFRKHEDFKHYNKEVHNLAYQYFNALFNVLEESVGNNVHDSNELINNVHFKCLVNSLNRDLLTQLSEPDEDFITACLNAAKNHLCSLEFEKYNQQMSIRGLNPITEISDSHFFEYQEIDKVEKDLREDVRQIAATNQEIGLQIFIEQDALATYIRKSPESDTISFTLFDPDTGVEKFDNADRFIKSLVDKVKDYNRKHYLPLNKVKYKKFYKAAAENSQAAPSAPDEALVFSERQPIRPAPPIPQPMPSELPEPEPDLPLTLQEQIDATDSFPPPFYGEATSGLQIPSAVNTGSKQSGPPPAYEQFKR